jgi:diguanylate cyclase (GGDEF)-like protein/PAS domain S-box-containing protein
MIAGTRHNPFKSFNSAVFFLLLCGLGFISNFYYFTFYTGVDFFFGSVFVLIITTLFGISWGLVAALIAGSCSVIHGEHIYLLFLNVGEALWVGFLQKKERNLLSVDCIFWGVIGIPAMVLVYYGIMHLDTQSVLLISLKAAVNGILNAMLANVVIIHLVTNNLLTKIGIDKDKNIPFREMLLNILMLFVMSSTVVITFLENRKESADINAEINNSLQSESRQILYHLTLWEEQHLLAVSELASVGADSDMVYSSALQKNTQHLTKAFPDFAALALYNADGKSVTFYPEKDAQGKSVIGVDFSDRQYFKDVRVTRKPVMSDVIVGRASVPFPLVVISVPIFSDNTFRGAAAGGIKLEYIDWLLKQSSFVEDHRATLMDRQGKVISSTDKAIKPMQAFDYKGKMDIKKISNNIYLLEPKAAYNVPELSRMYHAKYVTEISFGKEIPWTLVLEVPAKFYYSELMELNIRIMVFIFMLAVVMLIIATRLDRRMSIPLIKLAEVSTGLPEKMSNHKELSWPDTQIAEIDTLVHNFCDMADELEKNFAALQELADKNKEGKNKLEAILAAIGDGISIQDRDFRVLYQNDINKKLIGEHLGELCYHAYENCDNVCEGCPVNASFHDGNIHITERSAIKDGREIHVEITASPIKDAKGNIVQGVEVVRNISERKRSEVALQEYQKKIQEQLYYSIALNQLAEAIISNNDHLQILQNMTEIVGLTVKADRCMIFDFDMEKEFATGVCVWWDEEKGEVSPAIQNYDLKVFYGGAKFMWKNHTGLQSHYDAFNENLFVDGSAEILHTRGGIKTLYWQPFSFAEDGYYVLAFYQFTHKRNWQQAEIDFLSAVGYLAEIALQKARFITKQKEAEEVIQQQLTAMKTSMDGMAVLNSNGEYIYMNDAHVMVYGYQEASELIGKTWRVFYYDDELVRFDNAIIPVLMKEGSWRGEAIGKKKNGSIFPQELSLNTLENGGLICVVRDITERKKAQQIIWEEKERALVTLHSIGDAVIVTDAFSKVEYLNPVAEDLTGWQNNDAVGNLLMEIFNIVNEQTGKPAENPVDKCIREGRIVGLANHTELIHRKGHHLAIEDSAAPIKDKDGQIIGVIVVFHDVSEKRNLLQQMIHQAYHDPLTDLPNRILFNDRLGLALTQANRNRTKAALLFLDLDRFKLVNDMLGHAMGDILLKEVAERLAGCVRHSDTIARLGGDEFTILLPMINDENDVSRVAKKVLQVLHKPIVLNGHEFHVTASIGIVMYPDDGEDAENLMKHADTAMYRAKEQGRNNYQMFTPSLNVRIMERLSLENNLRHALERQELVVYYQPLVNIETGKINGMEALLRWQHPEQGLIPPMDFIPLAEETGLIIPIGEWVLQTACSQNMALQDAGFPEMRVAVNLSARQFRQKNLVSMVSQVLKETRLRPSLLELEITESVAMEDVEFSILVLRELRQMGINIAIDDFGTGYSSLNYLKRLPIHTLKIDRSFVRDIIVSPEDAAIVSTIIVLAQNLNLKVIAEGVETSEQLDFLRQRRCTEMQGFLFCRPVPVNDFEELLKKRMME